MAKQMENPVRWEQTLRNMAVDGFDIFIEVGPGKTLSGLVAKTLPEAKIYHVEDAETLNNGKGGVWNNDAARKNSPDHWRGRGIGRAIALAFAREGANVAVIYAGSKQAAEEVCQQAAAYGVQARAYQCDVADFDRVKETVQNVQKDLGGVDILVNNAGITRDGLVYTMKESDFDAVLDTNLKGAFHLIKHCYPILSKNAQAKLLISHRCPA